jgi:TolB protein
MNVEEIQNNVKGMRSNINRQFSNLKILVICCFSVFMAACQADLSGAAGARRTAVPTPTELPSKANQQVNLSPTSIPEPTGKIAFVSNKDGDQKVYVVGPDGENQLVLENGTVQANSPRWSSDGKSLAFVADTNKNTDIYYLALADASGPKRLTDSPAKDDAPAWSPDGQKIAFESYRDRNWEIYVVNVDGSGLTRITNDLGGDTNPAWSPDGKWIAFVSNRDGNASLYIAHPDGSGLARITQGIAPASDPVWSPDSQYVSFRLWPSSGSTNICVITIIGFQQNCYTSNFKTGIPAWSPNGQYLAFRSNINQAWRISMLDLKTTQVSHLSFDVIPTGDPVWAPDSLYLAFQARYNNNMEIFYTDVVTKNISLLTKDVTATYNGEPSWTK